MKKMVVSVSMMFLVSFTVSAVAGGGKGFGKADDNGDGGISFEEFKKNQDNMMLRRFNKIDTNKDGKIDKAEMSVAREAMKQQRGGQQERRRGEGRPSY